MMFVIKLSFTIISIISKVIFNSVTEFPFDKKQNIFWCSIKFEIWKFLSLDESTRRVSQQNINSAVDRREKDKIWKWTAWK